MKIFKYIKNYIIGKDAFRTGEMLRFKGQQEYGSLCGGVLTLLIIIGLTVSFYSRVLDTFGKNDISSNLYNQIEAVPKDYVISTYPGNNFMFGVQISVIDPSKKQRYFDFVLTLISINRTGNSSTKRTELYLQPCTPDHWADFPEIQKDYDKLRMKYWMCLPRYAEYTIRGKYTSTLYDTLQVSVQKCKPQRFPGRPCRSESELQSLFNQIPQVYFSIYFINPLINPASEDYLTYYLEDNNYIIFNDKIGADGMLFVEDFTIVTDESLLPYESLKQDTGGIIRDLAYQFPFLINQNTTDNTVKYCSFTFAKSQNGPYYERNFLKFDDTLSYIGGLIGIIVSIFFIVNAYNSTSYQIELGSVLFNTNDKESNKKMKKYNFINFLGAGLYNILCKLKLDPKWKNTKNYNECEEQVQKQLDVSYLLKRIIFLERVINFMFDRHHLIGLHLQPKITIEEAKDIRKKFMLKSKLLKTFRQIEKRRKKQEERLRNQQTKQVIQQGISDSLQLERRDSGKSSKNILPKSQIRNIGYPTETNIEIKRQQQEDDDDISSYYSDESSQSDDEDDKKKENIFVEEIRKLEYQSRIGQKLSPEVWGQVDPAFKKDFENFLIKEMIFPISSSSQLFEPENSDQQAEEKKDNRIKKGLQYLKKKVLHRQNQLKDQNGQK